MSFEVKPIEDSEATGICIPSFASQASRHNADLFMLNSGIVTLAHVAISPECACSSVADNLHVSYVGAISELAPSQNSKSDPEAANSNLKTCMGARKPESSIVSDFATHVPMTLAQPPNNSTSREQVGQRHKVDEVAHGRDMT